MPPASLALYTCDRVRQQLHRIVVMPLILIEQRLVEKNFEAPGRELFRTLQTRLRLVKLAQPSIQLRQPEMIFRSSGLKLYEFLILFERVGILVLLHQGFGQAVPVARVVRIDRDCFAVRVFGFCIVLRLGIRAAQKIVSIGGRRILGRLRQQTDGLLRPALVDQKLAQLFERGAVLRILLQHLPQDLLRIRVMIFETIQPRKPQRRISIVWFDLQNRLKLLDRLGDVRLWNFARARFSQCADINPRQQSVRIHVVRFDLQRRLRLFRGFAHVPGFRVDLRQPFHYHSRIRIHRQRFLVRLDRVIRKLRFIRGFVLQLLQVSQSEVVIRVSGHRIGCGFSASYRLRSSGGFRQRERCRDQKRCNAGTKNHFHSSPITDYRTPRRTRQSFPGCSSSAPIRLHMP